MSLDLDTLRLELVEFYQRMASEKLSPGTSGNISVRVDENHLLIGPSAMQVKDMKQSHPVLMDLNGEIKEGSAKPSSEFPFHLEIYKRRPDIEAVVHTHSTYATALACLGEGLPAFHYMVALSGAKAIPLVPYSSFGTDQLAQSVGQLIQDSKVLLVENHGLIAGGTSLSDAYSNAEQIENLCQVYLNARAVGQPKILPDSEMELILEKFKTYKQPQLG